MSTTIDYTHSPVYRYHGISCSHCAHKHSVMTDTGRKQTKCSNPDSVWYGARIMAPQSECCDCYAQYRSPEYH